MVISGNYSIKRIGVSLIVSYSECIYTYDLLDDMFIRVNYIILSCTENFDLAFFTDLLKIWNSNSGNTVFLVNENVSDEVLHGFLSLLPLINPKGLELPKLVVPVRVAVNKKVPENTFIGSIAYYYGNIIGLGFNRSNMNYAMFRKVFNEAQIVIKEIICLKLNPLETIIWIDNWFQKNIQYIENHETDALGTKYICPSIEKEANVTDVFLHHYGVCGDISASIAILLSFLEIDHKVIQYNGHAWVIIKFNDEHFIWDCTRNITRNEHMIDGALKAKSYTSKYTLVGTEKYPEDYISGQLFMPELSKNDFPRDKIDQAIINLRQNHHVDFVYDQKPPYESFIFSE